MTRHFFIGLLFLTACVHPAPSVKTPEPLARPTPAPAFQAGREIRFQSSILFVDRTLSIDGLPPVTVPCAENPGEQLEFGTIPLDQKGSAHLVCSNPAYAGGISMTADGANFETLSQVGGDAGDCWDIRSQITRGTDSAIQFQRVQLMSESLDPESDADIEGHSSCSDFTNAFRWNSETQAFVATPPDPSFGPVNLKPPIHVSKPCLDATGKWKSKNKDRNF